MHLLRVQLHDRSEHVGHLIIHTINSFLLMFGAMWVFFSDESKTLYMFNSSLLRVKYINLSFSEA